MATLLEARESATGTPDDRSLNRDSTCGMSFRHGLDFQSYSVGLGVPDHASCKARGQRKPSAGVTTAA
jgi:hypothetical protein